MNSRQFCFIFTVLVATFLGINHCSQKCIMYIFIYHSNSGDKIQGMKNLSGQYKCDIYSFALGWMLSFIVPHFVQKINCINTFIISLT